MTLPYAITQDHIDTYARDGVVVLRGLLDAPWVERMQAAIARVAADPGRYGTLGCRYAICGAMIPISAPL